MDDIWSRIEAWLDVHVPGGAGILAPGASDAEIAATEQFLGVTFPEAVRASFQRHNGQASGPWLLEGWELLSLGRIREEWRCWKDLLERGAFRDFRSATDGRTVEDWWHPAWIPLTYDGAGDHHCLDLHPGPQGYVGQIIMMWHDDDARGVAAPDYPSWLAMFAAALEAGRFVYSDQYVGLVPPEDV